MDKLLKCITLSNCRCFRRKPGSSSFCLFAYCFAFIQVGLQQLVDEQQNVVRQCQSDLMKANLANQLLETSQVSYRVTSLIWWIVEFFWNGAFLCVHIIFLDLTCCQTNGSLSEWTSNWPAELFVFQLSVLRNPSSLEPPFSVVYSTIIQAKVTLQWLTSPSILHCL